MIQPVLVEFEMRRALPATLQNAEQFLEEFLVAVQGLDPVNCFAAELLVREALTNAVVHGCRNQPGKQFRCSLRIKGGRLLIAVEDDGDGFDWRRASSTQAGLLDCSGRGLEILHKYANRVRYNNRGNAVTIIKRF